MLMIATPGARDCSAHVPAAQDKDTVQVPNGLAFSEFRGYEDWQAVAVSHTDDLIAVHQLRVCVPYHSDGKGLHFHGVSEEVNGKGSRHRCA
jgi:hypothetical protein